MSSRVNQVRWGERLCLPGAMKRLRPRWLLLPALVSMGLLPLAGSADAAFGRESIGVRAGIPHDQREGEPDRPFRFSVGRAGRGSRGPHGGECPQVASAGERAPESFVSYREQEPPPPEGPVVKFSGSVGDKVCIVVTNPEEGLLNARRFIKKGERVTDEWHLVKVDDQAKSIVLERFGTGQVVAIGQGETLVLTPPPEEAPPPEEDAALALESTEPAAPEARSRDTSAEERLALLQRLARARQSGTMQGEESSIASSATSDELSPGMKVSAIVVTLCLLLLFVIGAGALLIKLRAWYDELESHHFAYLGVYGGFAAMAVLWFLLVWVLLFLGLQTWLMVPLVVVAGGLCVAAFCVLYSSFLGRRSVHRPCPHCVDGGCTALSPGTACSWDPRDYGNCMVYKLREDPAQAVRQLRDFFGGR